MATRIKAAILLCLLSAAAYSVHGAYMSMHRPGADPLPEELSLRIASVEQAEYYLRDREGFVAVFENRRAKTPLSVTGIETSALRHTDRELLSRGIPVSGSAELLLLLEDLGS